MIVAIKKSLVHVEMKRGMGQGVKIESRTQLGSKKGDDDPDDDNDFDVQDRLLRKVKMTLTVV